MIDILIILLLLIANGVFALAETAIVSARRARLQAMAEDGNIQAQVALETANQPLDFLSSVQIGITLIGVLAGAFGGAAFAEAIAAALEPIPILSNYSDAIGVTIVVIIITYLSLIIGELVPKQIALTNPERMATLVAQPMKTLTKLTSPVVRLLTVSTQLVLRILNISTANDASVTLEEVQTMVAQATKGGVFEVAEQEMVEGVLRLDNTRVGNLMTPRTDVYWLAVDDPPEEIFNIFTESQRSRFPVAEEDLDQALGIIHAKDFAYPNLDIAKLDLKSFIKPALFFPENLSALDALEQFKRKRIHFAFVINEYGGVEGIVTPNDILEAIVGDITEPDDEELPEAVKREDGSWLLDGSLAITRMKSLLEIDDLPAETAYHTLAGFVLHQLGTIPHKGQQFEWQQFRFEIVDMDGRRVDQVLVAKIQADPA